MYIARCVWDSIFYTTPQQSALCPNICPSPLVFPIRRASQIRTRTVEHPLPAPSSLLFRLVVYFDRSIWTDRLNNGSLFISVDAFNNNIIISQSHWIIICQIMKIDRGMDFTWSYWSLIDSEIAAEITQLTELMIMYYWTVDWWFSAERVARRILRIAHTRFELFVSHTMHFTFNFRQA